MTTTFRRPTKEEMKQDPQVQKLQGYNLDIINAANPIVHKIMGSEACRIFNLLKEDDYTPAEFYMLVLQIAKHTNRNEDIQDMCAARIKFLIEFNPDYINQFAGWVTKLERTLYETVIEDGVCELRLYKEADETNQTILRFLGQLVFQWYFFGAVSMFLDKWVRENGENEVVNMIKNDVDSLVQFCGEGIA